MSCWSGSNGSVVTRSISYDEALLRIRDIAGIQTMYAADDASHNRMRPSPILGKPPAHRDELAASTVPLLSALGRTCAASIFTPHSTPREDTSAMDGFAVNAAETVMASEERPVLLRVVDSIAAGDRYRQKLEYGGSAHNSHCICVEIMTGASFPEKAFPHLDSVVKIEDVVVGDNWSEQGSTVSQHIRLVKPVHPFQHRRPAGSDFARGDLIIEKGSVFEPKHIAALASLDFVSVEVVEGARTTQSSYEAQESSGRLRIAVLSTGSEVEKLSHRSVANSYDDTKQRIPDSNGPYMVSKLIQMYPGAKVEYFGVSSDEEEQLVQRLSEIVFEQDFDIVVTSGGVSRGRHDLIRHVVETRLRGRIVFHGVRMRPGAPVLMAMFDNQDRECRRVSTRQTAFFGAPGNPVAAAVALQFFVLPYLQRLSLGMTCGPCRDFSDDQAKRCIVKDSRLTQPPFTAFRRAKPRDSTVFWLAKRDLRNEVVITDDQASYKLSGMLSSNCWVVVPAGTTEVSSGEEMTSYSL